MYFLRDTLLSVRHYCSRSRVFHMTLTTPQTFESEFHLRSLPCALSRQLSFVLVTLRLVFAATDRVQEIAVFSVGEVFGFVVTFKGARKGFSLLYCL